MTELAPPPVVEDAAERSRFEVRVGDELAGLADYQRRGK